jgi:fluoride exporter
MGAVLGASTRFTVGRLAASLAPPGLPLGTLIVNLVGCLLIGIMQTLFLDLIRVRREVQLFVSVGFLGGLTTFSSVSVESVRLIQTGALSLVASYQLISLLGGLLAALLGITLAHVCHRALARALGR